MSTNQIDDIDALIRALDTADALPGAADLRTRSYELLDLDPGASVVDVGCGAGRAVAELRERGADAIGVDVSERMLAARAAGAAGVVTGEQADAWYAEQAGRAAADRLFLAVPIFVAAASAR
ncbi:methyltransferase domain-containing protein [Actinoallomurus sp. NPDC052308]|uniref:methyltransferase domain-containing protein n=1 Tax=Actinoallomurus sp. NPDC052308 TaxID=3155530 RepID=UPI00344A8103